MKKIITVILIGIFYLFLINSIIFISAFPVYLKPLDSNNQLQPSTSFTYSFNFTTSSDCSGVVYTNRSTITTGKDGIGFIDLNISTISGIPKYLCEYRDGSLRKTHILSDQLLKQIYAESSNFSQNVSANWFFGKINWSDIQNVFNYTNNVFNLYNSTWDNSFMNQWNYNQTIGAITIGQSTFLNLSGTNANQNINLGNNNFTINGTTFFVNTNNGYVGIGTTNPTHKLHVAGSTNMSGDIVGATLDVKNIGGSGDEVAIIGHSAEYGSAIDTTGYLGGYDSQYNKWYGVKGTTATGIAILANVSDGGYAGIFMGGNVGIGTTSPSYPLHVLGANASDNNITAYFEKNISATGFITRTSVYDENRGKALDLIKFSSQLKDNNIINHSKFYGYTSWTAIDETRPVNETTTRQVCENIPILENVSSIRQVCDYELVNNYYQYVCRNETIITQQQSQLCSPYQQQQCSYVGAYSNTINHTEQRCSSSLTYENVCNDVVKLECNWVQNWLGFWNYVCNNVTQNICNNQLKQNCINYTEQQCNYVKVPNETYYERVCNNIIKQNCTNVLNTTCENYVVVDTLPQLLGYNKVCNNIEIANCTPRFNNICHDETITITTYPYKKEVRGVELGAEIDLLRQGLAEYLTAIKPIDVTNGSVPPFLRVENDISATDFITRTKKYDKNTGKALGKIKDANDYLNINNSINYSAYGNSYIKINKKIKIGENPNKTPIYDYVDEEGVSLGMEVAILKQAIYEMKQCTSTSNNWVEYQSCVGGV